jgi:4-hydroxymandelate oxidase
MTSPIVRTSRRKFLQYIAASPVVASGAIEAYGMEAPSKLPDPMIWAPTDHELIKNPKDAISVFDFEPVARKTCRQLISATWHRGSTTRSR